MRPAIGFLRWRFVLAGAALTAVLAGCGAGQSPEVIVLTGGGGSPAPGAAGTGAGSGDSVAAGRQAFQETCAACHGADGQGMPGLGKNLVTPSDWFKQQNDEALLQFLKVGRTAADPLNTTKVDMPPKGGNPALSDEDLKNIIQYLRSVQKK